MNEIILIGAGGHAKSCIDVIELYGQYKIAGVVDRDESGMFGDIDYPFIGTDSDLEDLRSRYKYALVTVGQIKTSRTRKTLFDILKKLNYKLPVIISPRAHVSRKSSIGQGTIIMHDVIVNSNTVIGENCIINSKCLVEHDVTIGDHCHLATGSILNGGVIVGRNTFIGSGVVTKQNIQIGSNCVIGAGAVLKSSIDSGEVIRN